MMDDRREKMGLGMTEAELRSAELADLTICRRLGYICFVFVNNYFCVNSRSCILHDQQCRRDAAQSWFAATAQQQPSPEEPDMSACVSRGLGRCAGRSADPRVFETEIAGKPTAPSQVAAPRQSQDNFRDSRPPGVRDALICRAWKVRGGCARVQPGGEQTCAGRQNPQEFHDVGQSGSVVLES